VALASGCVVKSGDGDDDSGGEGGESGSAGSSSGGKGGSSTGGKGGSATGGSSGSTTGGSSGSATGGSGNIGGDEVVPECDPDTGELDNTLYPDCEPTDADDPCELCIEANCCAESQVCYGYDPGNVCGWGGPDNDGEFTCYVACAQAYVEENGVYDSGAVDECTGMCATEECGLIGNATQDLVVCVEADCESECFGS
jgi:hypothetical protein